MKKKTVCISGSSGFLGSHLVYRLEADGYTVIKIPRLYLHDFPRLQSFFMQNQPEEIYHLAAFGNHYNQTDGIEMIQANIIGTYNMLNASKGIDYKAFINVSSSSVLLPTETMYSATKSGAERIVNVFVHSFAKPILTIRPYSLYGTGEADFRFIPTVFRSCITGEPMTLAPDSMHDWLYVDSFVEGILHCVRDIKQAKGLSLNFGTGIQTPNWKIVDLIQQITKEKANIIEEKKLRSFDTANWGVQVDKDTYLWRDEYLPLLEEGLRRTYPFYKERYSS